MEQATRPGKLRQHIYMTPELWRIARDLAEATDGGNMSRLVQRLIREEHDRRQLKFRLVQEEAARRWIAS